MLIDRRKFLTGLLAAPIIVRAGLLMPVRPLPVVEELTATGLWFRNQMLLFEQKPPDFVICSRGFMDAFEQELRASV